MNRIIIAGALGHIGSRVSRDLANVLGDHQFVLLDNLLTERFCSLFDLPQGRFEFVEADVTKCDLDVQLRGARAVVQLAAITDAASSFQNRERVEQNNLTATTAIAEACLRNGVAMLHLSSTSVYGTQGKTVDEDCGESELRPQSPYAETKLKEERLLQDLGKKGLRFVTLRFGTICGVSPGMRFHTAINRFCWQATLGQPITVWRTALHQKRPYLALSDASRAIQFCIERDLFAGDVYNVLTANLTVSDIVEAIRACVPGLETTYVDSEIMNQLSYEVIWQKFQDLGFQSAGSVESEIEATLRLLAGAGGGRVKLPAIRETSPSQAAGAS